MQNTSASATTKIENVIQVAERIATLAELVRATDIAAQDSRFIVVISDTEAAQSLNVQVTELREYVALAKKNIAKGMCSSKEEIFSELILGMCQTAFRLMLPASSVSVSIDVVIP